MTRSYPEEDGEESFLYVREWSDERLEDEFEFLLDLFPVVASEIAFRADSPEHRDGTGSITADDVDLYELSDSTTAHGYNRRRPGE